MQSEHRLIVISQRVVQVASYSEYRDCLDQRWTVWLESLDSAAVPMPNRLSSPAEFLSQIRPSGIILSGGNNIAADVYGLPGDHQGVTDAYEVRDVTERALIEYAIQNKIPLLGCCRGMQFLHAYFGGRLTSLEGSATAHVATTHEVNFPEGSLRSIIGEELLRVNSFHNYGVRMGDLSAVLKPGALSQTDQTVEAFVHRTLPMVGIMWHPERPNPAAAADIKIAHALFSSKGPLFNPSS